MNEKIPYATILAVKHGRQEAMTAILRHYEKYIIHYATRTYYDRFGNAHCFLDEDIRQIIEATLMRHIIYRFDPYRLPEGEVLEDTECPGVACCSAGTHSPSVRSCGGISPDAITE